MRYIKLKAKDIDLKDKTFLHSFARPTDDLCLSVRKAGILNPVVARRMRGRIQLVHGFRRVAAAARLRLKTLPACLYTQKELDDYKAFDLAFFDNVVTRPLNLAEKAMAANILVKRLKLDRDEIIGSYLPAMGLDPAWKILDELLAVADIKSAEKKALVKAGASLKSAAMFARLKPEDRKAFMPVLEELRPGTNLFREIIPLVQDISAREGKGIPEVIQSPEILKLMQAENLSTPQKLEAVMAALRQMRYPLLHEMNQRFELARSRLGLPMTVRIRPSPNFEETECRISMSFSTRKELRELAAKLLEASENEALKTLLDSGE